MRNTLHGSRQRAGWVYPTGLGNERLLAYISAFERQSIALSPWQSDLTNPENQII